MILFYIDILIWNYCIGKANGFKRTRQVKQNIFHKIILDGTWADLSAEAAAVFPLLLVPSMEPNEEDHLAFINFKTARKYSGLSETAIDKALEELEAKDLLIKGTVYTVSPELIKKYTGND